MVFLRLSLKVGKRGKSTIQNALAKIVEGENNEHLHR
jgi:hypothetical protein